MDPQETRTFALILIVCFTLGIIIIYFIVSIIRQQRRTLNIQKSVVLTELTAIERERARIATDLHDDISPVLSVIKFQIDNTVAATTADGQQLQAASQYIDEVLSRVREISSNLMPSSLLRKGLHVAIEEYLRKVEESGLVTINFSYDESLVIPEAYYANIFRIVQEVVYNVLKHAKATSVAVKVSQQKRKLVILVQDNGIGFDYSNTLAKGDGFGLQSLKNRTEAMDGRMVVQSKVAVGSAFLFTIPLKS
ncbi:MAG TPA: ATP-binding protein [Flavisolibacter sp.]|nr:ATP-binding protein [Flavisolibacter sp.]